MKAEDWLAARTQEAPEHLRRLMLEAVHESPGESPPDRFAEAALLLYGRAVAGTGGRGDALPLLAADALLTHAFQAQAELSPEGLASFIDRWADGSRLAELLHD